MHKTRLVNSFAVKKQVCLVENINKWEIAMGEFLTLPTNKNPLNHFDCCSKSGSRELDKIAIRIQKIDTIFDKDRIAFDFIYVLLSFFTHNR